MKVLISGKGGSGKSTITTLLAKDLESKGHRVLVVDTDESNFGLSAQLGMEDPEELMDHLGGKKLVGEKMWAAFSKKTEAELFKDAWKIEDIPAECLSHKEGIYLMQIGKIKHFGEGCACPMGGLSREFLGHLVLGPKDVAIIDTEAGVEHLGRSVEKSVDLILVVLDPSYESIRLSEKISDMAKEGNKPVYFILNKVDERSAEVLRSKVGAERIAATVPFDAALMESGLSGQELDAEVQGLDKIVDLVQTAIQGN
jgi:CO dehydrogenase maturation factor